MSDEPEYTTETARQAAARDELGQWVADFLASPGSDNAPLAELLSEPPRVWIGPVEVPLEQLHRLAGPSGHPVLEEVDDEEWRDDVDDLARRIEDGLEPAPVVVTHKDDELVVEDGNHRIEALRRAGVRCSWAVICFDDEATRDAFVARSEAAET
jgi:ParB-like nuclease family protein